MYKLQSVFLIINFMIPDFKKAYYKFLFIPLRRKAFVVTLSFLPNIIAIRKVVAIIDKDVINNIMIFISAFGVHCFIVCCHVTGKKFG